MVADSVLQAVIGRNEMDRQSVHQTLPVLRDVQTGQRGKAAGQMVGKVMKLVVERIFLRDGGHCLLAHETA